jgi:hypothetical protein
VIVDEAQCEIHGFFEVGIDLGITEEPVEAFPDIPEIEDH